MTVIPHASARVDRRGTRALVALSAVVVSLLVAGALVVAGAGAAHAHSALLSTDPQDGATVPHAPSTITLTFGEPAIALGTTIVVRTPDGRDAAAGHAPELVDAEVRQSVDGDLPAGEYTVEWRVTSQDGHPVDGTFTFTAVEATGSSPAPGTTTAAPVAGPTDEADDEPGAQSTSAAATPSVIDPGPRGGGPAALVIGGFFVVLAAVAVGAVLAARRARRTGA